MHEYPITQQIIKICSQHAQEHGAQRVVSVHLVVGDQSGFIGDSIQMYFDIIGQGTLCEGAVLTITPVQSKLRCEGCGALFVRKPFSFDCPTCGGNGLPSEIGKEFHIESIEVENG